MRRSLIIIFLFSILVSESIRAQDFIPIWPVKCMPNSRGVILKDSLDSDLIYRVSIPGLYIFKPSNAENKRAAVLIIPSGGYSVLSYATGFQMAKWFNTIGITAFVLKYRLPYSPDLIESYKGPLQDAQRSIKIIRSRAKEWGYDDSKVGVMGASAGGHIAACLSTIQGSWYDAIDSIDNKSFVPDFAILISPVISMTDAAHVPSRNNLFRGKVSPEIAKLLSCQLHVYDQTPPTFIIHAGDDHTVSPMNSVLYYTSLLRQGVKGCSLHIFPKGDHSIRVRKNPGITSFWPVLAENWLIETGLIY
ncbi:MAG: alpha/beta hydrolase [Bacteroides sp.]|nr:alpha/beta hydrolase [Bacteroides sp.]MCI1681326.1 alpha/beta hydrolase [Bacteroides sp.]